MHPTLLSAYATVHTVTLLFTTFTLLSVILPFCIDTLVRIIPGVNLDVVAICGELDDSFGADQGWLERCQVSFRIVKLLVAWAGLGLMVAQWLALGTVYRWSKVLRQEQETAQRGERSDLEGIGTLEEKGSLVIVPDSKV
jgi:hypothetical protein